MIVLPDGKVCRNLPEQVAENLKKIQEIIHFLDGVNIQDNLVVIADLSQNLTAAELEIVERPVAFIYYNDELYIKRNEDSGNAYFDNVFSINPTASQVDFASNEIEVVLSTGALGITSATASVYPTSQIDSFLALKADLTGATFTGPVEAITLKQTQANYAADITSFCNITGGTATPIFCRVQQINQEIHIVFVGKIANSSGSTISAYATSSLIVELPHEVALKIYDVKGRTAAQAVGDGARISGSLAYVSKNDSTDVSTVKNNCYFLIANAGTDRILINFASGTAFSIDDGQTMYFEGRVSLDLL